MRIHRRQIVLATVLWLAVHFSFQSIYPQRVSQMLSASDRIVGLTTLYFEAKYNFANWDNVPGLDWEKTFQEYLPQVEKPQSDVDYYFTLMRFYAVLQDGHTFVFPPKSVLDQVDIPPVKIRPIQGKPIITDFAATDEIIQARISKGSEIIRVDGRPVREVLEVDIFPTVAASTSQARNLEAYRRLLLGKKGTKVKLEVRDVQGTTRQVLLTRNQSDTPKDKRPSEWSSAPSLEHKAFEDGIHYFALNSFADDNIVSQFDSVLATLKDIKGIILDVRKNSGGSDGTGYQIISRLISKPISTSVAHSLQYIPFYRARGDAIDKYWLSFDKGDISPRDNKTFDGPVVVLTGASTGSAAEDFLIPFVRSQRAILVGERTSGSTGLPMKFTLPGGGYGFVCTVKDYYVGGRKWIGVGVVPNIELNPTIEDFLSGRDPVLQKGLEVLKEKIKSPLH